MAEPAPSGLFHRDLESGGGERPVGRGQCLRPAYGGEPAGGGGAGAMRGAVVATGPANVALIYDDIVGTG